VSRSISHVHTGHGRTQQRRRGSVYVAVLGCATVVAVIGISALTLVRIERNAAVDASDFAQARLNARAGVELGLLRIGDDLNWRTTYPNGFWETDKPIGTGSYSIQGIDRNDGDLTNNELDSLTLTGIGRQGDAQYQLQVTLTAKTDPIEALATAIHADSITIMGGKALTATGAPVSTNGLLQLDGGARLTGDLEAGSLSNGGTITGTATVPAPPKSMPDPGVFDQYANLATVLAAPSSIDKLVLTPGYNPLGATNTDGVYLISAGGATLNITNSRINGTLVVNNPGGTLVLDGAVFLHNYRADYPVLVANCAVEFLFNSDANALSEATLATNFNPAGAPYQGVTDSLLDDTYPSEIQGLVHMTGTLRLKTTARVRGVVICESAVTADDNNEIVYDPSLYANPPMGYRTPPTMYVSTGSWQHAVN